jgi:hypothetical protein
MFNEHTETSPDMTSKTVRCLYVFNNTIINRNTKIDTIQKNTKALLDTSKVGL